MSVFRVRVSVGLCGSICVVVVNVCGNIVNVSRSVSVIMENFLIFC